MLACAIDVIGRAHEQGVKANVLGLRRTRSGVYLGAGHDEGTERPLKRPAGLLVFAKGLRIERPSRMMVVVDETKSDSFGELWRGLAHAKVFPDSKLALEANMLRACEPI
jgi:hypothetical protein